nr:hypothetical protein [Phascolarctobacterium sp.]
MPIDFMGICMDQVTIEVEDSVEPGVNMVFPCNEIQKTAWDVLKNFDHALILREDDPLLPAVLARTR